MSEGTLPRNHPLPLPIPNILRHCKEKATIQFTVALRRLRQLSRAQYSLLCGTFIYILRAQVRT